MRKALFFLGILDDTDLNWMISEGKKENVPAGTVLVQEGRLIDSVFVVLEGRLTVSTAASGSKVLASLMCGEVVGEISFVDSRPPSASVKAVEPSCVLRISSQLLTRRLEKDPGFAARFYRALALFLADRLRSTVGLLGYSSNQALDDREYADEIDTDTLDKIALAGARFDLLQRKLRSM